MPENGTNTIDRLKAATGIADDRLSAHHPNGAGNQTKTSDFFIGGVGSWKDVDDDTVEEFVPEWTEEAVPVTSGGDCPDGLGGTAQLCNGDEFEIAIEAQFGGTFSTKSFGIEQVLIDGNGLSYSLNGCTLLSRTVTTGTSSSYKKIIHRFEVTGYDLVEADVVFDDGGYNSDATHYGQSIQYDNSDVETSDPTIDQFTVEDEDTCCPTDPVTWSYLIRDPIDTVGTEGYWIDWGDGTTETWTENDPDPSHEYIGTGNYTVTMELYTDPDQNDRANNSPFDTATETVEVTSGGQN
jgi:hypothetical protein